MFSPDIHDYCDEVERKAVLVKCYLHRNSGKFSGHNDYIDEWKKVCCSRAT